MLKGSCLCAGVSYEINGPLEGEITDSLPRYEEGPPR